MRPSIIDRYLLAETFKTWLAVFVVLSAVMLGNTFSRTLSRTAGGEFDEALLLGIVGATSASYFKTLIPLSVLLAILLSLGRLYRDNEMAVINACGIGLAQLYRPFMLFALVLALATAWLSLYLAPYANTKAGELRDEARFATNLAARDSGQFKMFAGGYAALYAEQVSANESEMHNVFGWFKDKQGRTKILWAKEGFQRLDTVASEGDLLLVDGVRYEGRVGENAYQITRFRQHGLHLPISRAVSEPNRRETTTAELVRSTYLGHKAELQGRLSQPIMVLVLALLAVPLARVSPRQGRYGRLVIGILCYLLYSNLLATSGVWLRQERIPESIGVWWVHLTALALIAWLFWVDQIWFDKRKRSAQM